MCLRPLHRGEGNASTCPALRYGGSQSCLLPERAAKSPSKVKRAPDAWLALDTVGDSFEATHLKSRCQSQKPTVSIEQLVDEIDLLAPESVARPATRILLALQALGTSVYSPDRDLCHMVEPAMLVNKVLAGYTTERNRFVAAAKSDLGTA